MSSASSPSSSFGLGPQPSINLICQKENFFAPGTKLDEVLSAQKPSSDKTGLRYAISSGPSSSTASRSKIVFVPQFEKGDTDMKSITDLFNSKSFVRPHVCHHCGVSGHIRRNCFKLYLQKQVSNGHKFPLKDLHLFLESY